MNQATVERLEEQNRGSHRRRHRGTWPQEAAADTQPPYNAPHGESRRHGLRGGSGEPAFGRITMTQSATVRTPSEGRTIAVVGDVYRFLATGEETNGKYAIWEAIVPPGGGPPPHVHSREEEGFYVLEGEITFQIGEEQCRGDGRHVRQHADRGARIRSRTRAVDPAKMLISVAPLVWRTCSSRSAYRCPKARLPHCRPPRTRSTSCWRSPPSMGSRSKSRSHD